MDKFKFDEQFRKDFPETIGESDYLFDLSNYKDWLEDKLETQNNFRKQVARIGCEGEDASEIRESAKNYII